MNVTLLLRMVQKIGNSLIAFSPVLTRMSVVQIYGTGFTPSLKKTMALAGLMALASTGAYALTKSAAEGEVNTPVEALIPMAKEYVANNNIDADSSATINNSEELAKLLSGTLSGSIEELTSEDISKKLAEKDADKIFTTFMTTNNSEQAKNNTDILNAGIKNISETYDNISTSLSDVLQIASRVDTDLGVIKHTLETYGNNLSIKNYKTILSNLKDFKTDKEVIKPLLDNFNNAYKTITGQDFPNISKQKELMSYSVDAQIAKVETGSIPIEQAITEIEDIYPQFKDITNGYFVLSNQYENLKENDIALLQMLLQQQAKFAEDGKSSAEEQAVSKELLKELVENASPMTRNYIIKLAEEQYKPENDPTGIVDISAGALSKMCFDLTGKQLAKPREGLNIVKSAEGTVQKVIVQ